MLFFSPPHDRKFVITKDNVALMYHAPGKKREFNAFVLDKTYYGPYDETTCIDWTDDSKWVVKLKHCLPAHICMHVIVCYLCSKVLYLL